MPYAVKCRTCALTPASLDIAVAAYDKPVDGYDTIMFNAVNGDIVLFEQWESRGSWQAHFDTEPIRWLQAELADKVELPVERLEMYAPGEPDSHIS